MAPRRCWNCNAILNWRRKYCRICGTYASTEPSEYGLFEEWFDRIAYWGAIGFVGLVAWLSEHYLFTLFVLPPVAIWLRKKLSGMWW